MMVPFFHRFPSSLLPTIDRQNFAASSGLAPSASSGSNVPAPPGKAGVQVCHMAVRNIRQIVNILFKYFPGIVINGYFGQWCAMPFLAFVSHIIHHLEVLKLWTPFP